MNNSQSFTFNNQKYNIIITKHAITRMLEREIDGCHIMAAILSLGSKRIEQYNNAVKDVFIMDRENHFSIVISIQNNNIKVITALDKTDCYVKNGTIAIEI